MKELIERLRMMQSALGVDGTCGEAAAALERLTAERDALSAGLAAALDFAGTVAGGSSWWEDVWEEHAAAITGEKK
jgi:hypothetical protein